MAKLTSLIQFTGSLDDYSAYRMEGVKSLILRRKGGASRQKILHAPCFENSRRCMGEFGGRSTATHYIFSAFGGLPRGRTTSGQINRRLTSLQRMDSQSPWGQRAVRLSLYPEVLRGLSITGRMSLDFILPDGFSCSLSRGALQGWVEIPALQPGVNCHHPKVYPYFRVVAVLGVVPDLFYNEVYNKFAPVESFIFIPQQKAETPWQPTTATASSILELQLQQAPTAEGYTLVLSAGVAYGKLNLAGEVEPAPMAVAAKVLAVV